MDPEDKCENVSSEPSKPVIFMDPALPFKDQYRQLEAYMFFHRQLYLAIFFDRKIGFGIMEQWDKFTIEDHDCLLEAKKNQNLEDLIYTKNSFYQHMRITDEMIRLYVVSRKGPEPKMKFYNGKVAGGRQSRIKIRKDLM